MKKLTLLTTGVLCAASMAIGAAASNVAEQIQAELRYDFKIIYDGDVQDFKNVNGETVYPILYEGSTYLPIRAVSNLFGKEITWYEADKRIEISNPADTTVSDADNVITQKNDTKETDKDDAKEPESKTSDTKKSSSTAVKKTDAAQKSNSKADIGIDKAKEAAVEALGFDIADVTITKAFKNDRKLYQINITHDEIDYEVEIDPETGKSKTIYTEGKKDKQLTSTEAKEIVYEKAGVDASEVGILDIEVHLDRSANIFTVTLEHDGRLYTAQISRTDGTVLEWEVTEE